MTAPTDPTPLCYGTCSAGWTSLHSRSTVGQHGWPSKFSVDGKLLASVGADGKLRVWRSGEADALFGGELATIQGASSIAFDPSGRLLAVVDAGGRVVLVDAVCTAILAPAEDIGRGSTVDGVYCT